ncbi:MAG: hybrid sensor histidine kinase/response regulator [Chroococcidiopsidaceae cyanobacterium CP_BM_ER_R8_30]|nr:hybrid sensor histidine kinase/response regulator [Chroococcidiopsidaceae cyanobacterium CP_BM_ER_R8_30]
MLPEQEQRILSFFIEESKDHLDTIERGVLNLQHMLKAPEMVNEVFRAAHSVKGGAAMLGLGSIQQTAHHLEDYFKILQECPAIPVDQKLESLLLRVFDALQEQLEQLENNGLSVEVARRLMSEIEPVFAALDQHLALLASQADGMHTLRANKADVSQGLVHKEAGSDLFDDLFDSQSVAEELDEVNAASAVARQKNVDLSTAFAHISFKEAADMSSVSSIEDDWFSSLDDILFDPEELPEPIAETTIAAGDLAAEVSSLEDFAELESLLENNSSNLAEATVDDTFSELDALLNLVQSDAVPMTPATAEAATVPEVVDDEFSELDRLVGETEAATAPELADDEFSELDRLAGETQQTEDEAPSDTDSISAIPEQEAKAAYHPQRITFEQTMRVPVRQLDNVSNLVGELVVYRNSLEQDQLRLRQFLDNLLSQVQQLSDVGSRMQELYERSLLEASLLNGGNSSRPASLLNAATSSGQHATGMDFDSLEMDRFTSFHTLSQEMIELIVRVRESSSDIEFITDETDQVARQFRQVTNQLQEGLTRSRMVPFAQIADRLPRAVRDISLQYGKQAVLQLEGRETLIDKVILEQLYDPMTHLVSNAITHGIETLEERVARGKSPVGQIAIRSFHQGNQTVIIVADDGAGIDSERVKEKAIQKGLISSGQAKTMSRLDVYNLLFHPGFSTKDQVDNFAGRGVGMDVVRTSLSEMRGAINIDSIPGKGTTFTIRLPLTLSICKALCCLSEKARIAFPMDGVEDMMDVPETDVQLNAAGQSCVLWRDSLLPFRPLKELLTYNRQLSRGSIYGSNREDGMISIVVLRSANTLVAVQVDQVLGEQEIVIKQFQGPAPKPVGVAGATVLGDGRIMPIADVLELIDLALGRISREDSTKLWTLTHRDTPAETPTLNRTEPTVLIVDDSITVRELLSLTFGKAGYRVEQARDGQEAWDKLRDGLPCDLVFCDIEMPKMDGLELLSRMQKDPNLSHVPVAMLTSRGADRHRQMAIQLGASGYFTKPYLEESLLDGAKRMLRGEVMVASSHAGTPHG